MQGAGEQRRQYIPGHGSSLDPVQTQAVLRVSAGPARALWVRRRHSHLRYLPRYNRISVALSELLMYLKEHSFK